MNLMVVHRKIKALENRLKIGLQIISEYRNLNFYSAHIHCHISFKVYFVPTKFVQLNIRSVAYFLQLLDSVLPHS